MTTFDWGGGLRGADRGAQSGAATGGGWGALAGGASGFLIGALTPDGNSLHDYREALDDQYQRQQRWFNWLQGKGLHPLSVVGAGGGYSPSASISRNSGGVNAEGIGQIAGSLIKNRYARERLDTERRLTNAQIDAARASAERDRAEAAKWRSEVLGTARSRSTVAAFNSNKDQHVEVQPIPKFYKEGVWSAPVAERPPGMSAQDAEDEFGGGVGEIIGFGNYLRQTLRNDRERWAKYQRALKKRNALRKRIKRYRYERSDQYKYWSERRYPGGIRP